MPQSASKLIGGSSELGGGVDAVAFFESDASVGAGRTDLELAGTIGGAKRFPLILGRGFSFAIGGRQSVAARTVISVARAREKNPGLLDIHRRADPIAKRNPCVPASVRIAEFAGACVVLQSLAGLGRGLGKVLRVEVTNPGATRRMVQLATGAKQLTRALDLDFGPAVFGVQEKQSGSAAGRPTAELTNLDQLGARGETVGCILGGFQLTQGICKTRVWCFRRATGGGRFVGRYRLVVGFDGGGFRGAARAKKDRGGGEKGIMRLHKRAS